MLLYNLVNVIIKNCIAYLPTENNTEGGENVFDVLINILVGEDVIGPYERVHPSYAKDVKAVFDHVEGLINKSQTFQNNRIRLNLQPVHPESNILTSKVNEITCEGSMTSITNLLNDINHADPSAPYIVFLPCSPEPYTKIFNSVNIDIPIISHTINTECAKRVAILKITSYSELLASLGNAILTILSGGIDDMATVTQTHRGDDGIESKMSINDIIFSKILNSPCNKTKKFSGIF